VLGTLLVQADAAYAALVHKLFRWDGETVISHLALIVVFTWLSAAYLAASLQWTRSSPAPSTSFRIGAIEAGTVLAVVDALFLSFVLVQARYLFGGVSHVLETVGLTYAEYARRGFFELVAVSALTLPLLIIGSSGTRIETVREKRIHRILTGTLVGLLLLMMASAFSRMWIYQAEYGWTLDRVYATALMLWIGGSILWFAATALRGAPQRFMIGSLSGGLAMLAGLAIINPAAAIVTANTSRVAAGKDFDGLHAARLSTDALPALLTSLPKVASQLDEIERCAIRLMIDRVRYPGGAESGAATEDWRSWRVSDARASAAVARRSSAVDAALATSAPCARRE
jgi:hypothetical protein